MGSQVEIEAANIMGPGANGVGPHARNRIGAIGVTTTSARANLATYISDVDKGHYLTFVADGGDVYIAFTNTDAGSIDQTNVTAGNAAVCWKLSADVPQHFRILENFTWLIHKAATGTPTLRFYLSSCGSQGEIL